MGPRKYDGRSRLAAAEETKRRIVRATVELHAEHGGLGTTHEMIAARAGVSLPTVYKYFPTRNDLIPHCTGLVMSEAPVQLGPEVLDGHPDVVSRLRALARVQFASHAHAEPWLRWAARDAAELPALRAVLDRAAQERTALVRAALKPGFPGAPPRRLVAVATTLLDFPAFQAITAFGFSSAGAAALVGDALATLAGSYQQEDP